jgi:hypothetical protein
MKKVISATALFAVILWGSTAVAPLLRAQDVKQDANQSESRSIGAVVTDEGLQQMLDNMGFDPKKLGKGYLITIKRDAWTYNMQILLSPDKTKIGFNANLGIVENPDSVTAEQWKNLLISNGNIDPSFFFFDKDTKKLYLHRVLDNRGITPSFMRQQIENFCGNIKETGDLWKFTK